MPCLIGAPCSGSGKTLLSLCLAALARSRGLTLQPFKVGPDYLDPQLLSRVSGRPCRNLDPVLCGDGWVQRSFAWHGRGADQVLVEGVMGLFDGRGPGTSGSSAAVAALLDLPVVLVVEASRQAGSLAALVRGFRDHGPPAIRLAGVVLNRVSGSRHRALLAEALASIEVPLLGILPTDPALELPSRHLGLLPPGELADLPHRLQRWAALAEQHLDLERLEPLLRPASRLDGDGPPIQWCVARAGLGPIAADPTDADGPRPLVAVASDAAFHFRYPEGEELLRAAGLDPQPWSPLADQALPAGTRAVVIPGGYPELHAARLAACRRSIGSLQRAAGDGLPIAAECGGLLLLGRQLTDPEGDRHRMAGLLPFDAARGELSLGYRQATALTQGLLVRRGERFFGHEFHRWQLRAMGAGQPLWEMEGWGVANHTEGWTTPNVHASWLHLHWAGCPVIPFRLAAAARAHASCATLQAAAGPARPTPPSAGV
jgi:cobyrinic acid a,c-diamide synthase